jgi:type VI protein secretion system component Hcp
MLTVAMRGRSVIGGWFMRNARTAALLAVGALGGGAAFAVASVPDGNGTIHACVVVSNGTTIPFDNPGVANIRIIDPSHGQSCASSGGEQTVSEIPLTFNTAGPAGPAGPTGPAGAKGSSGSPGPAGPSTTTGAAGAATTSGPTQLFITLRPTSGPDVGPIGVNHVAFEATTTVNVGSAGSGAGAGKVKFGELELHKAIDATSPVLFKALAAGQHFAQATVFVRTAGAEGTLTDNREYRMSQVFVTRLAQDSTTTRSDETIQLAFGAIQLVEFTQSASGKPLGRVVGGWDQTKNTAFTPTTLLPAP